MDALFLDHYDRELAYLRELGGEFAQQYPKIAGRLGLGDFACNDPFVERLLEGFAFMSARVQRRMDAEFPQFVSSLFEAIYPHYGRPIPSAGIFQLQPDLQEGSLVEGYRVPRGSRLYSRPAPGQQTPCRFDTSWDVDLWPIQVTEVEFFSRDSALGYSVPREFHTPSIRSGMQLVIESAPGIPLNKVKLDCLRLHLRGGEIAQRIYETLLARSLVISTQSQDSGSTWINLPTSALQSVGFEPNGTLLPDHPRSFSGYPLLQEYFLLPEKFLFLDLHGLRDVLRQTNGNRLKILFGLESPSAELVGRVGSDHMALHCVPAVNLFLRRADRIHLDHTQHEHLLVSDRSRPIDFEVWSIKEMSGHRTASNEEVTYLPLYAPPPPDSPKHRHASYFTTERRPRVHSESRRQPARSRYLGTELFVTLTDSNQAPFRHEIQQLSSLIYCTNRDLPLLQPTNGWREAFTIEAGGPVSKVLCLTGPTPPKPPVLSDEGERSWRLISHLTPNYLSLMDNAAGGAAMLRELLLLYCGPEDRSASKQIEGVDSIRTASIVRRLPCDGPLTYGRGIEIELHCDEQSFAGGGAFLLGCILEQFFARFVSINSFTETHLISTQRGTIARWPTRFGLSPLI